MKQRLHLLVAVAVALLCLWLGSLALPYIAPFLPALVLAVLMEPVVSALQKHGLKRSRGAGLMTLIALSASAGLILVCAAGSTQMVSVYAGKSPLILDRLSQAADTLQLQLTLLIDAAPPELRQPLTVAANTVADELSRLPIVVSQKALDGITVFAMQSPDWLLFFCTALIGTYFFSAYYPDLRGFLLRQLTPVAQAKCLLVRNVLRDAVFGSLKIQCILSGITFLILLIAFTFIGISDKLMAAFIIAVVDALPILGSGIILIPWALVCFATGNLSRGLYLLLIYALLLIIHNVLQAKLMGSHLGLHPITALVSLYAGWKLSGLAGMLLLPIACILLCSLNNAGVIRLYR